MSALTTCFLLGSAAALALWGSVCGAMAQVTLDGTANPNFEGPLDGPDYQIGAELGRRAGRNLFHSFERFGLRTGESATFSGPNAIRNVISRVTGGARSDIDGTLRSTIPGADFFFLNPAGVMFGPNARLDLQGSFQVSTADELRFADGTRFSASNPAASSFTVARPEAFGFLGAEAGRIAVDESILQVPSGAALSIVGGDIDVKGGPEGFIAAEAGQITLAALGGPGEARLGSGEVMAEEAADITLTDQAAVDASGDGGGTILIRGGEIIADGDTQVFANNNGARDARGGLDIDAEVLRVRRGSELTADALSEGTGGDVAVRAGTLEVSGNSVLAAGTFAQGNAGDVEIDARQLRLRSGGNIQSSTFAQGNAGAVAISAEGIVIRGNDGVTGILSDAEQDSRGNGGRVSVEADHIEILQGGSIRSNTFAEGNAGAVDVEARRLLVVRGAGSSIGSDGATAVDAEPSTGNAGVVSVHAPAGVVRVLEGGVISSDGFAFGNAGAVTMTVGELEMSGGRISSLSFERGITGTITIQGASRLVLDARSLIFTASAVSGGGDIRIEASDLILLRDGSGIRVDVFAGGERAGNITIDPTFLVLDESAIAATADAGSGGEIDIKADNLILSPGSEITARAGPAGIDGTVVVSTPEVDLSGGLVVLDAALLDVASQLRERCGARRDIGASSFTGVGRGSPPPSPDSPLLSDYASREKPTARSAVEIDEPETAPGAVTLVLPCRGPA